MAQTIGELFLRAADDVGERPLFTEYPSRTITYREALICVAGVLQRFRQLGLQRGDAVGCYLEAQVPSALFGLACALSGVRPAPLSPIFSPDYFRTQLFDRCQARGVFTTERHVPALVSRGFRPMCFTEDLQNPGFEPLNLKPELTDDQAREIAERAHHGLTADDVFMFGPTSGSTGAPKLALRKHQAFLRYARFVGDEILAEGERHHRFLAVAALTHAFGLHMFTTALRLQGTLCIPTDIDTGASLTEVRALDPTVLPMVPRVQRSFYLQSQTENAPKSQIFGPSARFVCSAGGCPNPDILETMRDQGLQILEFYGSTEASIVALSPRNGWRRRHSGRIVADAEVKVASDSELLVRSSGLMFGYYGDELLTKEALTEDGYYRTGDLARVTDDGYLQILGRKRDVFNTAEGSNIYPERIELLIEGQPVAFQAMLVGDQKPYLGALIVPREFQCDCMQDAEDLVCMYRHSEVYQRVAKALSEVNRSLECVEKVGRFLVLGRPFPADVYKNLGAKVRRDRKQLTKRYQALLDQLYTPPNTPSDLTFVPGVVADMPTELPA